MTDRLGAAPPRADRAVQGAQGAQGAQAVQKDADAYRTISEVAEELGLPQHVLRFWETRFPQVKPLKRAGGRRFYRPEDVDLLRAVQALLYGEGYTIKGVQRLLADHGARQVAEALARSRAVGGAPEPAAVRVGGEAAGPTRQRPLDRTEPSLSAAVSSPRAPATGPAAPRLPGEVAGRLSAVHADLVECARLLASVRST